MRQLSLLILCMFCTFLTFGQEVFNVSGTVNFNDGSPADGIFLTILSTDSNGNFVETAIYSNPNGFYSHDAEFPSGTNQGSVEITMQDCDNTFSTQTVAYIPGTGSAIVDFIYCANSNCEVIVETIDQGGSPYLIAENMAGTSPFTYQWSSGEITGGIYPTASGVYCVTMTDVNGCAAVSCEEVTSNPPSDCNAMIVVGSENTAYTTNTTSNAIPVSWEWQNGSTAENTTIINAGYFCVTVTYDDGCIAENCTYYVPTQPCEIFMEQYVLPSGEVAINAVPYGGEGQFSYLWDSGATTNEVAVSQSGNYCMTITDEADCYNVTCVDVVVTPPADSCSVVIVSDPTNSGVVLATNNNTSNALPVAWQWSTGETTNTINAFQEGNYCVTVTYANGCTAFDCFIYNPTGQDTLCYIAIEEFTSTSGEISLEVNFQTGVEPYNYYWSNGQLGNSILPSENGQYCVTMTDADGCYAEDCINVIVTPVPDSCSTTITMDTVGTAIILGTANYGSNSNPVNWLWDNGATTNEIEITQAGNYCVTVTYADGCFAADCYTYVGANECSVELNQIPTTTGFVHIETIQQMGVAPYTYSWNFGVIGNLVTVSESGTYCVTMTDAVGCTSSNCTTVEMDDCEISINGSFNLVGNYVMEAVSQVNMMATYTWNTGNNTEYIEVSESGTYCVEALFSNGCISTACMVYTAPPIDTICNVLLIEQATPNSYLVHADATGVAPFTYDWNNGQTGVTNEVFTSGVYCVAVTDANGCVAESCITITINPPVDSCNINIVEEELQSGEIMLVIVDYSSSSGPASYEWASSSSSSATNEVLVVVDPGTYCVTVTFEDGCIAEACYVYTPATTNCDVFLTEEVTPNGHLINVEATGVAPFYYDWNNGQIESSIAVLTSGMYCVTVTDANGCAAESCVTITINPPVDSCVVNIMEEIIGQSESMLLLDYESSSVPVSFEWTTGATEDLIDVVDAGTYCVTVTFADGCMTDACYVYEPMVEPCGIFVSYEIGSGNIPYIEATAVGVEPYEYLWSDGSTTSNINAPAPGTYCLTLTDAVGCTSVECVNVNDVLEIEGYVWANSTQGVNSGTVFLVQYNEIDSTLVLIDSTFFSSDNAGGYYHFTVAEPGSYMVKAALDATSPGYSSHLPTYHQDQLFWDEATPILLPAANGQFSNIIMVQGNNPGGPGFIAGHVLEGANKPDIETTDTKNPGDPIADVSVLLLDINDNPIMHTATDEQGRFEFDDVPLGVYKVFVEIWGKDQGMEIVTLDENTPEVDNISFDVNETYTTITAVEEIDEVKSIKLFPNPMNDSQILNLEVDMSTFEQLTVEIISVNGNKLLTAQENVSPGVNIIQLNTDVLQSGIYFLNIKSSNGVMTRKFIR